MFFRPSGASIYYDNGVCFAATEPVANLRFSIYFQFSHYSSLPEYWLALLVFCLAVHATFPWRDGSSSICNSFVLGLAAAQ